MARYYLKYSGKMQHKVDRDEYIRVKHLHGFGIDVKDFENSLIKGLIADRGTYKDDSPDDSEHRYGPNMCDRYALYDAKNITEKDTLSRDNYSVSGTHHFFEDDQRRDGAKNYLLYGVAVGIVVGGSEADRAVIRENGVMIVKIEDLIIFTAPLIGVPDVYVFGKKYFWTNYMYCAENKTRAFFSLVSRGGVPTLLPHDAELRVDVSFDGFSCLGHPAELTVIFDTMQQQNDCYWRDTPSTTAS